MGACPPSRVTSMGRLATGDDWALEGSVNVSDEPCGVCGGDRRIGNSFGLTTTCPSCHGSGRKAEAHGFHDVTKTKPSHYRQTNKVAVVEKQQWPVTFEGGQLATEVRDSKICLADAK